MSKKTFNQVAIIESWKTILESLGLDINDPNFVDTPKRIAKMYNEIFAGLLPADLNSLEDHLTRTFPSTYTGIIAVKNIIAWGTCPHHFLPVKYHVNVGYIPKTKVAGLSKIPRVVTLLAARPVMQEQLVDDIVEFLNRKLDPKGLIVEVKGEHHCMIIRGIKQEASATTSSVSGLFKTDPELESKFYVMP